MIRPAPALLSDLSVLCGLFPRQLETVLAPAKDFVKKLGIALEVFQDFGRRESRLDVLNESSLLGGRVDPVRNAVHAANDFLAALGKHEVDEQAGRVGMRRLGGNARGMNIGKDRI